MLPCQHLGLLQFRKEFGYLIVQRMATVHANYFCCNLITHREVLSETQMDAPRLWKWTVSNVFQCDLAFFVFAKCQRVLSKTAHRGRAPLRVFASSERRPTEMVLQMITASVLSNGESSNLEQISFYQALLERFFFFFFELLIHVFS